MAIYYDRGFRGHDLRRPSGDGEPAGYRSRSRGGAAGDYNQGYRNDCCSSAAFGGGNVFSANQEYAATTPRNRPPSPEPPRYPPPARRPPSGGGDGGASAWCFSDPEMKRRRRVAAYKAYAVEGKAKASMRRGFRWIKNKCSRLVHSR